MKNLKFYTIWIGLCISLICVVIVIVLFMASLVDMLRWRAESKAWCASLDGYYSSNGCYVNGEKIERTTNDND